MILECDALYDLQTQRNYEALPFRLYQKRTDISIFGSDFTKRTCTKRSGWKYMLSIVVSVFDIIKNTFVWENRSKLV